MLRGPLDDTVQVEINAQLPDIDDLVKDASSYGTLDENSKRFLDKPEVPIAGVCLRDAISILSASRFATFEAFAHQRWSQEHTAEIEHPELYAAWCGQFFADDAALRLYAVGEHVAKAIVYLLEISASDLQTFKANTKIPYSSYQMQVGLYLTAQFPMHPITQSVTKLASSTEWKWIREYRNNWVHEQPPLMAGFGIQFQRTARWRTVLDEGTVKHVLSIGNGDKPAYTVDELVTNVRGALIAIVETTRTVAEHFAQTLNSREPEA